MERSEQTPTNLQLPPSVWIEQLEELYGKTATSQEPRAWEEEFSPRLSTTATRQDVEGLAQRIDKLERRIQTLACQSH
jgi:polyhydroxyalkanoate synthesis regulator phasin